MLCHRTACSMHLILGTCRGRSNRDNISTARSHHSKYRHRTQMPCKHIPMQGGRVGKYHVKHDELVHTCAVTSAICDAGREAAMHR